VSENCAAVAALQQQLGLVPQLYDLSLLHTNALSVFDGGVPTTFSSGSVPAAGAPAQMNLLQPARVLPASGIDSSPSRGISPGDGGARVRQQTDQTITVAPAGNMAHPSTSGPNPTPTIRGGGRLDADRRARTAALLTSVNVLASPDRNSAELCQATLNVVNKLREPMLQIMDADQHRRPLIHDDDPRGIDAFFADVPEASYVYPVQVRPRDDVPALRWGNRIEESPTALLSVHLSPAMTNTEIPGRTGAAQSAFSDEGAIAADRPKQVVPPLPTSAASLLTTGGAASNPLAIGAGGATSMHDMHVLLSAPMPTSRAGPSQGAISTPHSTPAVDGGMWSNSQFTTLVENGVELDSEKYVNGTDQEHSPLEESPAAPAASTNSTTAVKKTATSTCINDPHEQGIGSEALRQWSASHVANPELSELRTAPTSSASTVALPHAPERQPVTHAHREYDENAQMQRYISSMATPTVFLQQQLEAYKPPQDEYETHSLNSVDAGATVSIPSAATVGLLLIALLMDDVGATALVGRSSGVLQFAQNYPAATAQQIASGCDPPSIWRHTMRGENAAAIRSVHEHSGLGHHGEAPRHCNFRAASRQLHALVPELSGTV
jgi:hypothetical protein